MSVGILVLGTMLLLGGQKPRIYDHAVVTFYLKQSAPLPVSRTVTVRGKEFAELRAFFPAAGTGKKGSKPAGWTAWAMVDFRGKQTVRVSVASNGRTYSYGRGMGDFLATPGLKAYLERLQERSKPVRAG